MSCLFHVFLHVVTPIIMGLQFLEETETMNKYRERLVRVPRPAFQALSICSVGKPRQLLSCGLNKNSTTATPDTGSEIDLISPQVVSELGMSVLPGEEILQLADGSNVVTSGYVRVSQSLRERLAVTGGKFRVISTTADFYVLQVLTHRIVVGEETLDALRVFTENRHCLISADVAVYHGLSTIRHIGSVDRFVAKVKAKLGFNPQVSAQTGV
jgi:hypothetical protein